MLGIELAYEEQKQTDCLLDLFRLDYTVSHLFLHSLSSLAEQTC